MASPETSRNVASDYPRVGRMILLLFYGYVIFWFLQMGYRIPWLGAIRLEFVLAAVLSVLALFFSGKTDLSCPLVFYVILYFVVLIVQMLFSLDFQTSWNIFVDRVLKFSFMAVFIVAFVKTPRSLALFVGAFLLACLKMGQEGLVGKITGSLVWQNQGIMRLHGTTPLYTHPNSFAGMAMGTLPFSYFLWPAVGVFPKIALLTLVVFSVNIIVFSGSRTAYVALVGLGILLLWQTKRRALFLFVGAVILAVGLMRVPQEYIDRFRSIFTLEEAEGDSSGRRLEILADAWKIFLDHPFGVGIRAFPKVRREVFGRIQDTHNLYLEILTNLGIHGFIVVALFFYKMIRTLLDLKARLSTQIGALQKSAGKGRASGETDVERHLSDLRLLLAVSNAVLMYVAIRLILGFFGMDLYEIYWWLACGTTISIFNMNRVAERKTAACLEAGRKAKENG